MVIAIVALLILAGKFRASLLFQSLFTLRWPFFVLALVLVVPNICLQVAKWHGLLKSARSTTPFQVALKSTLVGFPLGFATPGRLGEIGRALFVHDLNRGTALKLAVIDKGSNLVVTTGAGLLGLFGLLSAGHPAELDLALRIINWGALPTLLLLWLPVAKTKEKWRRYFADLSLDRKAYCRLFGFSFAFYAIFFTQFICLLMSFQSINPLPALAPSASVFLAKSLLPISIGDLGIREGFAIYFLSPIGVHAATAFNAALLLFLLNVGLPTVWGTYYLFEVGRHSSPVNSRNAQRLHKDSELNAKELQILTGNKRRQASWRRSRQS